MRVYECTFIASGSLAEVEVKNLITSICSGFTQIGGKVLKKEYWGLLNFAYKIRKNKRGYYFLLIIECSYETLNEFKRKLSLNDLIIRFLFLQAEKRKLKVKEDPVSLIVSTNP